MTLILLCNSCQMKKTILLFLITFYGFKTDAQQWDWARKADTSASNESVNFIRNDGWGNVYLLGAGNGGSKYGNTVLAAGYFIVKFNSLGSVLWAENIPGSAGVRDFTVDKTGNVYLTGYFYSNVQVFTFNFTSHGQEDFFLVKLNPLGVPQWGKEFGGAGGDLPGSIITDSAENIYITGVFTHSISFGADTLTDTGEHFFLTKLTPSGNTIWCTKGDSCFGGGSIMALDKNSNVYVIEGYCYYYRSIAKFDSSGNLKFYMPAWNAYQYDDVSHFAIDNNGNVVAFHNGGGHYGYVPILVKYDSLMNKLWEVGVGTYYGCYDLGAGILLDTADNIFIAGGIGSQFCHDDSVYFDNQLAYIGHNGVPIIARFDPSGNLTKIIEAKGTNYDGIWFISQDQFGNIYSTGTFNYSPTGINADTLTFGNTTLVNDGNWEQIYIAKLNPTGIANIPPTELNSSLGIFIFPNPAPGKFTVRLSEDISGIDIYNAFGKKVFSSENTSGQSRSIDMSAQPKGIYFVDILSGNKRNKQKIIIE
jgi:hypothetical protein